MSRKETVNTFSEGLIKDLNPINTPNTALTDCLNGTIITYDGNEYSLQNDKGNYPLKNCKLKPGYIPVGTTEYGGIIYIVSYNPVDKRVEIGSYPSARTVTSTEDGPNPIDIVEPNIAGNYTELVEACKLYTFYGTDPEKYKMNPGDAYKLDNVPSVSAVDSLSQEYYVVDENRNLYDVTELHNNAPKDDNGFKQAAWEVPGWLAVKYHIASVDSFGIGLKTINYPNVITDGSQIRISFRFRITASDPLIINAQNDFLHPFNDYLDGRPFLKIKYKVFIDGLLVTDSDGSTDLYNEIIPVNQYSLNNGDGIYYEDTSVFTGKCKTNTVVTVEAVPCYGDIVYDQCATTYTYRVSNTKDMNTVALANNIWKYQTLDNYLLLQFNTAGLDSCKNITDLTAKYEIKTVDGTFVKGGVVEDWQMSGMDTVQEIPWDENFVPENMYTITLSVYSNTVDDAGVEMSTSIYDTTHILIASKLLNKFKNISNFDTEITFKDWIDEYTNYIQDATISLDELELGAATVENADSFTPISNSDDTYGIWMAGNDINTTYNTLLTKSSYNKVAGSRINISKSYNYTKDFTIGSPIKLLTGPLWKDTVANSEMNFYCEGSEMEPINPTEMGTVLPFSHTISGTCGLTDVYYPDQVTGVDSVNVWTCITKPVETTDNTLQCTISKYDKGYGEDTYKNPDANVTINNKDAGVPFHGLNLNPVKDIANQLSNNAVSFLEVEISPGNIKSNSIHGLKLDINGIHNKRHINTHDDRGPKSAFFIALPTYNSLKATMQIIQIDDTTGKSIDRDTARDTFNKFLKNLKCVVCEDDRITGGFIQLIRREQNSTSYTTLNCKSVLKANTLVFNGKNLLDKAGREDLYSVFKQKGIENTSLLSYDDSLISFITFDLPDTEKTFRIKTNDDILNRLRGELENEYNSIKEHNALVLAQLNLSTDKTYTNYKPDTMTFEIVDPQVNETNKTAYQIVESILNDRQKTSDNKACFELTNWWNGTQNLDKSWAFAYSDPDHIIYKIID